jgi:hypothetical protein
MELLTTYDIRHTTHSTWPCTCPSLCPVYRVGITLQLGDALRQLLGDGGGAGVGLGGVPHHGRRHGVRQRGGIPLERLQQGPQLRISALGSSRVRGVGCWGRGASQGCRVPTWHTEVWLRGGSRVGSPLWSPCLLSYIQDAEIDQDRAGSCMLAARKVVDEGCWPLGAPVVSAQHSTSIVLV